MNDRYREAAEELENQNRQLQQRLKRMREKFKQLEEDKESVDHRVRRILRDVETKE